VDLLSAAAPAHLTTAAAATARRQSSALKCLLFTLRRLHASIPSIQSSPSSVLCSAAPHIALQCSAHLMPCSVITPRATGCMPPSMAGSGLSGSASMMPGLLQQQQQQESSGDAHVSSVINYPFLTGGTSSQHLCSVCHSHSQRAPTMQCCHSIAWHGRLHAGLLIHQ
jgi:hypothetical protein